MIDYISDWRARLRSNVYEQFRGLPKFAAWVGMIATQAQDLEDATQALLTIISIDDSVGAQLDNLGRIIGQARAGVDDDIYRTYLRARILINKSTGTAESLYRIFRVAFAEEAFGGLHYVIRNGGNKSFVLQVLGAFSSSQTAAIAVSFLREAKEAGARAILEWQDGVEDNPGIPTANIFRFNVLQHGFGQAVFGSARQV